MNSPHRFSPALVPTLPTPFEAPWISAKSSAVIANNACVNATASAATTAKSVATAKSAAKQHWAYHWSFSPIFVGPVLTALRATVGCPGARLSPVLRAALARYPTRDCRRDPCSVSLRCYAPARGTKAPCVTPPYRRAPASHRSSFQSSGALRPRFARTRRGCPSLRAGWGASPPAHRPRAEGALRSAARIFRLLKQSENALTDAADRAAPPSARRPPFGRGIGGRG